MSTIYSFSVEAITPYQGSLPRDVCKRSPCVSQFPAVVTYERVKIPAGHFRRVLQLEYNKILKDELHLDDSIKSKLRKLGEDEGIDMLGENGINCAFVSPIFTCGGNLLEDSAFGIRVNGQSCMGNVDVDDPSKKALMKLIQELEDELKEYKEKIIDLNSRLEATQTDLSIKDTDIKKREELCRDIEEEKVRAQEVCKDLERQLEEISDQKSAIPLPPQIFDKDDLSYIKEGLTVAQVLELLAEAERLAKIREEAVTFGIQSNKTYLFKDFDIEFSHGIDASAVLNETVKELRVRIDYQLKSLMLFRNSRSRLLPISTIMCVFNTEDQFSALEKKGYLTAFQAKNAHRRLVFFGMQIPFVLEFLNEETKKRFCDDINFILDSIEVERENINHFSYQRDGRVLKMNEIIERPTSENKGVELPSSFKRLLESPVSSSDEN